MLLGSRFIQNILEKNFGRTSFWNCVILKLYNLTENLQTTTVAINF